MPRVPVLPTVQLNPAGPAQYSAPGVVPVQDQLPRQAMAMGEAFQQAGAQWGALAADVQRRRDIAETDERLTKVAEDDVKSWSAYSQLKGKAAVDGFDAFDKDQQRRYREALEAAGNDQQRQWLKEKLADRRLQVWGRALGHRDEQSTVHRIGVSEGALRQSVADVVAFDGDRTPMLQALRQRSEELAGLTGAQADMVTKAALTDAHDGIARRYVAEDRPGEAVKWLQEHRDEMDPEQFTRANTLARNSFVEWGARSLDADPNTPTLEARLAVVDQWEKPGHLTSDEANAARRQLLTLEDRRQKAQAEVRMQVQGQAEQWLRANPSAQLQDNPQLFEAVQRTGAVPQRARTTDPQYMDMLRRIPMGALQQLNDAQLMDLLGRGLDEGDANKLFAVVRGDASTIGFIDRMEKAMADIGLPKPVGDSAAKQAWDMQYSKFQQIVDQGVQRLAGELKRKPYNTEIQEHVLDPMIADKAFRDLNWFASDPQNPLVYYELQGVIPPADESGVRNFGEAGSLYVMQNGQQRALRDIPDAARRRIREDWARKNPGVPLTAADEWAQYENERQKILAPVQGPQAPQTYQSQMAPVLRHMQGQMGSNL